MDIGMAGIVGATGAVAGELITGIAPTPCVEGMTTELAPPLESGEGIFSVGLFNPAGVRAGEAGGVL